MSKIRPDDFIAWLITQNNSRGTLYLERVVRHYVRYLQSAPSKLMISLSTNEREVFDCTSTAGFDKMRTAFLAAPNYRTVNENGHQSFSAGMNAYRRYLEYLERQSDGIVLAQQTITVENNSVTLADIAVPESIIKTLSEDYANGFRFDTTTVRLLSEKAKAEINDKLILTLKRIMFRRSDDLYFLPDMICNADTGKELTDIANNWLDGYGCFEISELYEYFADKLNNRCVDSLESFQAFYEFINRRDVRCVEYYRTRIARVNRSVKDLFADLAARIIAVTRDEFGGTINEDDLRERFTAFSANLLAAIIKEHAEELVKTEINGIVCYQTLDALGLPDEFSETLAAVLGQIDDLGLTPSEETLHTALSIHIGVNFKTEYNIPDDKTYRRLIETYYQNASKRKWLKGIFAEVPE